MAKRGWPAPRYAWKSGVSSITAIQGSRCLRTGTLLAPDAHDRPDLGSALRRPHFLPNLLERAITEVNDLEPDIVVCSGDLTTFGFKEEYAQAKGYLDSLACDSVVVIPGNHDSRNVGYVHFEELFGDRNSVLRRDGVTVVAVDSTEPDLDHGQIGRGRYAWIEEQFAAPADLRIFVLHHHLLPVPGTGRERNIIYDAGDAIECLQRAGVEPRSLRAQARAVRVAAREPVHRQRRDRLVAAAPGQHAALLQRDRDRGRRTSTSGAGTRSTARSGSSSSRSTRSSSRSTRADRGRGDDAMTRALVVIDGEHYAPVVRDALAELPYEFVAACFAGGTEKLAEARTTASPSRGLRGRARRMGPGGRRRPFGRAGARARGALAAREPRARTRLRYEGADFRFEPPALEPFPLPSLAVIGTGKRVGKTAVTGHVARVLSRSGRSSSWRWAAAGRRSRRCIESPPTLEALLALSAGRRARRLRLPRDGRADRRRTVGCRRCGGGLAGAVATSNVLRGRRSRAGAIRTWWSSTAAAPRSADRRRRPHSRRPRRDGGT